MHFQQRLVLAEGRLDAEIGNAVDRFVIVRRTHAHRVNAESAA